MLLARAMKDIVEFAFMKNIRILYYKEHDQKP